MPPPRRIAHLDMDAFFASVELLTYPELRGEELLEAVCKGRGFLMKGGVCDYDRCCAVVLDEFRAGKVARVTLELPEAAQ